jgi:hypothetical protein
MDPPAMRALARGCIAVGEDVGRLGREAATLGRTRDGPLAVTAGTRLDQLGGEMVEWGSQLVMRAAAIETGQRAAEMVAFALESLGAVAGGAPGVDRGTVANLSNSCTPPGLRNDARGRTDGQESDVPSVVARLDRFILEPGGDADATKVPAVTALLEALSGEELVQVVGVLAAAGHDADGAARLGDVIGGAGVHLAELLARFGDALDARDPFFAALLGHAVLGRPSGEIVRLLPALLDAPGRLGTIMWGAAIGGDHFRVQACLDHLVASISNTGGAASPAEVAAELMRDTLLPHGAPWRAELDRTIAAIIAANPDAVLGELAAAVDPEGSASVPWVRRLFGEPEGPRHLRSIVTALLGEGPLDPHWLVAADGAGTHRPAIIAGYLNGVLVVATRLEASGAHDTVAALSRIAAIGETLAAVGTRLIAVADVLLPGSFGVGVDTAADAADERIDRATQHLLDAIDERFEPDADPGVPGLAGALLVLDDRRDDLVHAWFP